VSIRGGVILNRPGTKHSMQSFTGIVTFRTYTDFVSGLEQWAQQRPDPTIGVPLDLLNHLLLDVAGSRVDAVKKVEYMLTMGADVNARRTTKQWRQSPSWEAAPNQGKHVLAVAVQANALGVMRLLLDKGADVHASFTSRGQSSLLVSGIRTSLSMTKLLVEHGVSLDVMDDASGDAPLAIAAASGKVRTAMFLIKHGVDVNKQSRSGVSALHRATMSTSPGSTKVVRVLLEAGANPHIRSNYPGNRAVPHGCGYTALQRIRIRSKAPDTAKKIALLTDGMLECIFERRAAFAMALQERLGANSMASMLNSCVMQTIMGFTTAGHCDPQCPSLEAFPTSEWILLGHEHWSDKFKQ
jgi:hypothetical protein